MKSFIDVEEYQSFLLKYIYSDEFDKYFKSTIFHEQEKEAVINGLVLSSIILGSSLISKYYIDEKDEKMKYKWRLLYKPPLEEIIDDDPDTWRKTFFIDKYECPEQIDLSIKINELKELYHMKNEYIILEDLEKDE